MTSKWWSVLTKCWSWTFHKLYTAHTTLTAILTKQMSILLSKVNWWLLEFYSRHSFHQININKMQPWRSQRLVLIHCWTWSSLGLFSSFVSSVPSSCRHQIKWSRIAKRRCQQIVLSITPIFWHYWGSNFCLQSGMDRNGPKKNKPVFFCTTLLFMWVCIP